MKAIWDWLITPPAIDGVLTSLSAVYLVVFLIGFVASAYGLRGDGCLVADSNMIRDRLRRCAAGGLWIFGAGLAFFAVRALQIDPLMLGAPIWMILAVAALIVGVLRCVVFRTPG